MLSSIIGNIKKCKRKNVTFFLATDDSMVEGFSQRIVNYS